MSPFFLRASRPHSGPNHATRDALFVLNNEIYFQKTSIVYSICALSYLYLIVSTFSLLKVKLLKRGIKI